jgi:hypothetical protein
VAVAVMLPVAVAIGFVLMLPARGPLVEGQTAMERGRSLLLRGDLIGAQVSFGRAQDLFGEAQDRLGNPLTLLAGVIPVAGRTPDAVLVGARAGALAAEAGATLATGVKNVPGGPAALAPRDGTIDVDAVARLAGPVGRARALIGEAHRDAARAPTSLVPLVVTRPLAEARAQLLEARRDLVAADTLLRALPSFLGAEEPKRYFFGAQNPAELRGTGGLIGSYSIVTIDRGRITLERFADIGRLGHVEASRIDPPNPDYGLLYGRYGAMGDMSNINMTPDFPSAATAIERLYEHVTGERLDGTMVADPEALALLLETSGPVEEPVTGVRLDAGTVVRFVTNEAYTLLPDDDARKRVLGNVAGQVLAHYLSGGARDDPVSAARGLFQAGGDGHLLLHATDPEVQRAFDTARLSGRLLSPPGDFLAVVVNNASGSKVDFYAERTVRYGVTLLPDGGARGHAEVEFHNAAPADGQPAYVIGPHPFTDADPGDSTMIVQTYCAPGCTFEDTGGAGNTDVPVVVQELGHPLAFAGLRVPSGETARLDYGWSVPNAWPDGLYRLTFQGQPTIRPTRLEIDIRAPRGMAVVDGAPGIEVREGQAIWEGPARDVLELWVRGA